MLQIFEDFICENFNMSRRSESKVNFVTDDMSASLDCLNEAYEIEKEIVSVKATLRVLREKLLIKKKYMSRLYNKSRRNFPNDMFTAYSDVVNEAQIAINDVAKFSCPSHQPLIVIKGKVSKEMEKVKNEVAKKRRRPSYCIERRCLKRLWNAKLDEIKSRIGIRKNETSNGTGKILPTWSKNDPKRIKIILPECGSEESFEVYKPNYSPNPFESFMLKM